MRSIKILLATTAMFTAAAAQAEIIAISPSTFNDSNVFADGNQRGTTVIGTFDGGVIDFTGMNTENDFLTTFTGGQAVFRGDLTGRGNSTFDLTQLNFMSNTGATFGSVEFRLFDLGSDEDATIILTDNLGDLFTFTTDALRAQFGGGADRFAFQGIDNQSIASVSITSADGFQDLRQLRLSAAVSPVAPVPEPATWAMMLLGFGFIGGAMRSAKRRQRVTVSYA